MKHRHPARSAVGLMFTNADWPQTTITGTTVSSPLPRIVLAHGCFDLLHLGHIRHLQEARAQGDYLIVSVTIDDHVGKGIGRPHFSLAERVEALQALAIVDEVIVSDSADAVNVINQIKPSVYCKGMDYADHEGYAFQRESKAVEAHGGRVHLTATQMWSSSRLINTMMFSEEVIRYLEGARKRGLRDRIALAAARAAELQVCFVGETIIDEYRYVEALGRPSKEFMLATVETDAEVFQGGIVAASKHGEWRNVECITPAKTIRKTRYVDRDFNRKLFDVYSARKLDLSDTARLTYRADLRGAVDRAAVVIVNDFGHGLLGPEERNILMGARFLAVNAQTNAGNFGFNPVTKYRRAHYVCVDNPEARLATGLEEAPVCEVANSIYARMGQPHVLVTHGKHGSFYFNGTQSGDAPVFALGGVDTMGAGDAVMAVTAPLIAAGLDLEAAAFVGNVVGGIKVSILGHRRHVAAHEWQQTVESLLK